MVRNCRFSGLLLALILPGLAFGQVPAAPPADVGLPLPDPRTSASWSAALDEYERPGETVIAEVGSRTITRSDVVDAIRALPPIVSAIPFDVLFQETAGQLMRRHALVLAAESAGLDKEPMVQRRGKNAADDALATEMLRRSVRATVTEAALHELYDTVIAGKEGPDKVRARIIMVETKEVAAALIERLRGDADFGDLARDFSKDGTARNGGDLGYARLDMLAPELGAVIFALAPGQITAYPVRSGNHWFVIRVEGRMRQLAPGFEEARAALEQDVIHAAGPELSRLALKSAAAKYYGPIGKVSAGQALK